jgi:KDO2-lipid IV(A) lauroyltransferase
MPWAFYRPMAWVLARLMRLFMRERGHIARVNIRLCFPDMSRADQDRLWRDSFDSMAFSLFEFARGWWGKLRPRDALTPVGGMQNLQDALARGKGVILVSAHLTTLEYCNMMLCHSQPIAAMYRPFDDDALEWSVRNGRMRHAAGMFPRGELRPVLRHLKSNGILWFAPDQETRRGDSVFVPFFGQQAWSLTSTHQLAKLSGASVLPFFHQRLADGGYRLEIGPALENFPSDDASVDTAQVMGLFEGMIRRCPEQYLWMHARFKRQADGGSSPY